MLRWQRNPGALGPTFLVLYHLHLDGRREKAQRISQQFASANGGGAAAGELSRYAALHSPHHHYLHGEVVHDAQQAPRALQVITSGTLRSLSPEGALNETLTAGDVWDLPVLSGAPWAAQSLVAWTGAATISLPRPLVQRLLHALPRLAEETDAQVRSRYVSTLLPAGGPLAGLPEETVHLLRRRFEWQRFPDGARIIWKGAAARGLYLLLEGVVRLDTGECLQPGATLGTLTRNSTETITATAVGRVRTLVLRPQTAETVLATAAELAA
jgi:signal-transduction protein with cAMP-binding, CBS, and nucleotidyltransferase domain